MNGAAFKEASHSHKLSPVRYENYLHPGSGRMFRRPHPEAPFVSATYVSIEATCPDSCAMKGAGCYAQSGFQAPMVRILDAEAVGRPGIAVIEQEAELIGRAFGGGRVPQDGARGGRDLRLHVFGDVPDRDGNAAAKILARAAARWRHRGGGAVFTYTHQWHQVERASWGEISVIASCDQPHEVRVARRRGYAAALVVGQFPGRRAFRVPRMPTRAVPCPAQTSEVTCATCRLCIDRDLHDLEVTIAFAAHGQVRVIRDRVWSPKRLRVLP